MKRLPILTLALLLTTASFAGPMGPMGRRDMRSPMEQDLFPPELVLTNQIALGLSTEQIASIKKQVGDTHGRVLDVQVDLHRVTEQLHTALAGPKLDESAVLALASQAMDLEKQIKTAHLTLMIRVKNLLTQEQQDKARALAPQARNRGMRKERGSPEDDQN